MQVNLDHKDHPYILDCYYTSHHHNHRSQDVETLVNVEDEPVTNTWAPPDIESNQDQFDDNWRIPIDDRINNNLEASTSRTVIQHFDFRNPSQSTQSHWWARRGGSPVARTSVGPEASFLEPPNFHENNDYGHHDNLSDISFQEQDMRFGRGIKKEDFNLFFDDIYDAHSQSPPRTSF